MKNECEQLCSVINATMNVGGNNEPGSSSSTGYGGRPAGGGRAQQQLEPPGACRICGEHGHWMCDCPNKQQGM